VRRPETKIGGDVRQFRTTRWNLVLASRDGEAMEALIRIYWKPLYFFVRRAGHDPETAKDIVQEFLAGLLEKGGIEKADPSRGRFRAFLRASMGNFLKDRLKAASRDKRKPQRRTLSLDFAGGEREYAKLQPASGEAPDEVLSREWARSLWVDALARLTGERAHLEAFWLYLRNEDYDEITRKTGLSESAAKVAVHRLKARLRESIVARIKETVSTPKDLEAELAEFKSLLS
jgi:RNA polymerase sigma factor (sigma-70 family)